MKVLYGYPYYPSTAYGNVQEGELAYVERLKRAGYDVKAFCLSLNPPSGAIPFSRLDKLWKKRDRDLMQLYDRLWQALEGVDVLYNAAGINLHPEFVESLPQVTAFACYDDPESSDLLSKPVAAAYDICLVGNIAELDSYWQWGAKRVEWLPLGSRDGCYDLSLTKEKILTGEREIDLFMVAERLSPWRQKRFDILERAFPEAYFFGAGWRRGYLPPGEEVSWLQRTKIGPNIHNSTGPINLRAYCLPANGVLQICDNKSHLGKVYKLEEEVVGFDTVGECIDLCRYYLAHDEERRRIAANGWERAMTDYTELSVFERFCGYVRPLVDQRRLKCSSLPVSSQHNRKSLKIYWYRCIDSGLWRDTFLSVKKKLKEHMPLVYSCVKKMYFYFVNKKDRK